MGFNKKRIGVVLIRQDATAKSFECGIKIGDTRNSYKYPAMTWTSAMIEAEHAYTRCTLAHLGELSKQNKLVLPQA